MKKIAVLASGRGSNFNAILRHIREGRIQANVALVLSNVPDAPVIATARAAGIAVWAKAHKEFPNRTAFDEAMLETMREHGVEYVVLAGYMRLLSAEFIRAYAGKIINIHPSLLPSFPGVNGGGDAVRYGVKLAGCTVHFVVEEMDAGPVIIQAALPVNDKDDESSLMRRMHVLEHRVFPQAVAWLVSGRLQVEGRLVRLLSAHPRFSESQDFPCLVQPPLESGF